MKMNNKGQVFAQLGALGVGIAGLAITLVVTFLIITQGRSQAASIEGLNYAVGSNCTASATCNATNVLISAVATVPNWIPLIVIAVIGAILIGLVAMFRSR